MFFSASLTVDPSKITRIQAIPPTKVFKKLLFYLSSGSISEKEEVETITAISILQQINRACRSIGVNNIVRLSKDDVDFYYDEEGRKDDLKETMDKFEFETDMIESEAFKTLELVLEHEDHQFKYLIEISVRRIHRVREYPIEVKVNGVLKQFDAGSEDTVKKQLSSVFASNDAYEAFVKGARLDFDRFVGDLEMALRKSIKVDDIRVRSANKIVRPKETAAPGGPSKARARNSAEPVFYGYPGFGDVMLYAWMWSALCHDHNIYIHDSDIVDETGAEVMSVGDQGFDAGQNDVLNPEAPLEESVADFEDASLDDTRNAFEDSSFDSDSGSDSGDSGSSCSSCSSCGGGCGGD